MRWSKDDFFTSMKISDKFLHASGNILGLYVLRSFNVSLLLSIAIISIIDVLWELIEIKIADGFSWKDLVADFVGVLVFLLVNGTNIVSVVIGFIIYLLLYSICNYKNY